MRNHVARAKLLEVLTGTLFDAPVYRTYGSILVEERFTPAGFKAPLGLKDMRLVGEAADKSRVAMPLLAWCATICWRRSPRRARTSTGPASARPSPATPAFRASRHETAGFSPLSASALDLLQSAAVGLRHQGPGEGKASDRQHGEEQEGAGRARAAG